MLPHSLELLLHDGVLVDDGMLRLELVVVSLIVFFFFLVQLDSSQGKSKFFIDKALHETSLNSLSWSSSTDFKNLPTSL